MLKFLVKNYYLMPLKFQHSQKSETIRKLRNATTQPQPLNSHLKEEQNPH